MRRSVSPFRSRTGPPANSAWASDSRAAEEPGWPRQKYAPAEDAEPAASCAHIRMQPWHRDCVRRMQMAGRVGATCLQEAQASVLRLSRRVPRAACPRDPEVEQGKLRHPPLIGPPSREKQKGRRRHEENKTTSAQHWGGVWDK